MGRVLGVLRGDRDVVREVAADPASTWVGLALVAVAGFLGNYSRGLVAAALSVVLAPALLFLLVALLYVSTRIFGGKGSYLALWRPAAFAWVVSSLNILGGLSVIGPVVSVVIGLYFMFLATVIVRSTQGLSAGRSVAVVAVAWGMCACLPLGGLMMIGQSSSLAPFVYAIY